MSVLSELQDAVPQHGGGRAAGPGLVRQRPYEHGAVLRGGGERVPLELGAQGVDEQVGGGHALAGQDDQRRVEQVHQCGERPPSATPAWVKTVGRPHRRRGPGRDDLRTLLMRRPTACDMAAAIAVSLATDSRQPRLPQWHSGPSGSTTMWPNSPAAPLAALPELAVQHEPAADPGPDGDDREAAVAASRRRTTARRRPGC